MDSFSQAFSPIYTAAFSTTSTLPARIPNPSDAPFYTELTGCGNRSNQPLPRTGSTYSVTSTSSATPSAGPSVYAQPITPQGLSSASVMNVPAAATSSSSYCFVMTRSSTAPLNFVNQTIESFRAQLSTNENRPKKKRVHATEEQLAVLQDHFDKNPTPDAPSRERLAIQLGMPGRVVQVWFQNRRAKLKSQLRNFAGDGALPAIMPPIVGATSSSGSTLVSNTPLPTVPAEDVGNSPAASYRSTPDTPITLPYQFHDRQCSTGAASAISNQSFSASSVWTEFTAPFPAGQSFSTINTVFAKLQELPGSSTPSSSLYPLPLQFDMTDDTDRESPQYGTDSIYSSYGSSTSGTATPYIMPPSPKLYNSASMRRQRSLAELQDGATQSYPYVPYRNVQLVAEIAALRHAAISTLKWGVPDFGGLRSDMPTPTLLLPPSPPQMQVMNQPGFVHRSAASSFGVVDE